MGVPNAKGRVSGAAIQVANSRSGRGGPRPVLRAFGRLTFSACACLGLACAQQTLTRQGPYWVEVLKGSEPLEPAAHLQITCRGAVTVSGAARNELTYTLKVRVKAPSQAEAARLMRAFSVRISKPGRSYASLIVERGNGMADLEIKIPRAVPEASINTTEGDLTFSDLDGSVRAQTGGGVIQADGIRGNVWARTAGGDVTLGNVDGNAECITAGGTIKAGLVGGEATFETGGGDIMAHQVNGLARASTMGGTIRIERAGSAVIASTGGGPIDVGQAHGQVTAKNSGGPVKVGSAQGVRCENAAGGVKLDNVSGSVRVTTAVGNIIASLLGGKPISDSFLATGGGDITVFIPSNVGLTIRAQNEVSDSIRRIISEFPGITVRVEGGQVIAEGPVNGGGPILRISDNGGTIFIKRQH